jgi:hypothetical protein
VIFFFAHAAAPPGVTPLPLGRGDLYSEVSNVVEILMLSGSLCRRARVIRRRAAAKTQRHTQSKQWQRSHGRHQEITVTTRRRRSRPERRVPTRRDYGGDTAHLSPKTTDLAPSSVRPLRVRLSIASWKATMMAHCAIVVTVGCAHTRVAVAHVCARARTTGPTDDASS